MKTSRIRFLSGFLFLAILPTYCAANITFDSLKLETTINVSNIPSNSNWQTNNPIPNSSSGNGPDRHWYNHPFSNGRTYHNNYGHEIVINAWGGSRYSNGGDASNRCNIQIFVDGQLLADTRDNNHNLAKSCFASANVPRGGSYIIRSNPWDTWGNYRTAVKVFR
ncbi:hypothetical protein QMU85_003914 [Photobacterium damselae]|nr:hypothetical protein [Photobacterium damselae]